MNYSMTLRKKEEKKRRRKKKKKERDDLMWLSEKNFRM